MVACWLRTSSLHQDNFAANLRIDLKKEESHLRDALPAAAFVGFTGTPVETEDRITTNVFGPCCGELAEHLCEPPFIPGTAPEIVHR